MTLIYLQFGRVLIFLCFARILLLTHTRYMSSRVFGADAILLIVAALAPSELADYRALAGEIGLAALVEVHTEKEMQIALDAGATLIGINSRDLNTFVTDLGTVERLAAMVPAGVTLVAESGIKTPADVERVAQAGAKAILVGETFMRAPDIGAAVRELMRITPPPPILGE